jgi:C4-dicarboxylate-specific signal transduction histidine kinase
LRYRRAAESLETALRDLRESQEHLRRAERLSVLGEVAAGLAHEIRTPLAGVKRSSRQSARKNSVAWTGW